MIINLVLDKTKLLESSNATVVTGEGQYFITYGIIKQSIRNNKEITVISYSTPVFSWLSKAFLNYPDVFVRDQEITYKVLLSKKWKIDYDIDISDSQIINEKL